MASSASEPEYLKAESFHAGSIDDAFFALRSNSGGLRPEEAAKRLQFAGENALPEARPDGFFIIFFRQFQGPLIAVLLAASVIVLFLGDIVDSIVILVVLIINAVVGMIQEGKAQDKLAALKKYTETEAMVIRGGREIIIPDRHVVPGDVIVLREGDKVPADSRLIQTNELSVDEAALTGESNPVSKTADQLLPKETAVADQKNMVFRGTYALSGLGKAVVVKTGGNTVIGRLAEKLSSIDADVPLKAAISRLSRGIMLAMGIIIIIVFLVGLKAGYDAVYMFKTVVAIAVSIIPEGLPVVVTLILATGVWRMSERNALVKKLQAVEALGQAKVIALDKTGTITKNQMMVETIFTDDKLYLVSGNGYEPAGEIRERATGERIEPLNHPDIVLMAKVSLYTTIASIAYSEEEKEWKRISGEPTEAALMAFGQKLGFTKEGLEKENPKLFEIPFSSRLKYHATVNRASEGDTFYVASAPEVVFRHMNAIMDSGKVRKITDADRSRLNSVLKQLSDEGFRVLALAVDFNPPSPIDPEKLPGLTFVGFAGITDVIRSEVYDAVEMAKQSGVKTVMITGDYRDTAIAIGKKIGLYEEGDKVITGTELDSIDQVELAQQLPEVSIFARVTPEHKLKIIEAYKRRGDIIAMTGDGVNDALSLMAADLGVAMGKIGTEVAKEAADIVLLDDNFASIIAAIEEGRNIYHSIRKVVLYLLSTATGEVLAISGAILLGFPIPLSPSQIIWLNLVTDGFLVVALGLEPKGRDLLSHVHKRKSLVDGMMLGRIMLMGAAMTAVTLFLYVQYLPGEFVKASTIALTTLAVTQWFNVWNCRSQSRSIFNMQWLNNTYLLYACGVVILLQLAVIYVPFMQHVFKTSPLAWTDWGIILLVSLTVILVEETRKFLHSFFVSPSKAE